MRDDLQIEPLPAERKFAGYLLLLELFVAVTFIAVKPIHPNLSGILLLTYLFMHLVSCILLGIAAHKMGRSWYRFGVFPVVGMLPLAAYSWFALSKKW